MATSPADARPTSVAARPPRRSSSSSWLPPLFAMAPPPPPAQQHQHPQRSSPRLLRQSSALSAATSSPSTASVVSAAPSTPSRSRRSRRPSHPSSDSALPSEWGDDIADVMPPAAVHDFLSALVDNDFSSPSSYPPFLNPPERTASHAPRNPRLSRPATTTQDPGAPRHPLSGSVSPSLPFLPPRVHNPPGSLFVDDPDYEPPSSSQSIQISFAEMPPPPPPPHHTPNADPDPGPAAKRRRVDATQPTPLALPKPSNDDDIFGDDVGLDTAFEALTPIDLTETDDVPEQLRQPDVDNRVKLAHFQCVICMDDVAILTVTHCGHLYCQKCLHSSLHNVEIHQGRCPMCRAKVDLKARPSYTTKTKGYWPLELKLMTVTKQGKRKAGAT